MNMHMIMPKDSAKLDALAERYRTAATKAVISRQQFAAGQEQTKIARAAWIEATLELAVVVKEARISHPDHREFSRWRQRHELEHFSEADYAALSGFGRNIEAARTLLEASRSLTWRGVWEKKPKRAASGTPSGVGEGTISARGHLSGSAQRKRKRAPVIPTVMRDDFDPSKIDRSKPPSSRQQRQRRDPDPIPPPERKAVILKGLTREQVDPDFVGTALEFATKYGHVRLHTKQELEHNKRQEELMAWLGTVSDHERTARAMLAATVDPATLREWMSKPAKAAKMQAWRDSIKQACESLLAADHDQNAVAPCCTSSS